MHTHGIHEIRVYTTRHCAGGRSHEVLVLSHVHLLVRGDVPNHAEHRVRDEPSGVRWRAHDVTQCAVRDSAGPHVCITHAELGCSKCELVAMWGSARAQAQGEETEQRLNHHREDDMRVRAMYLAKHNNNRD